MYNLETIIDRRYDRDDVKERSRMLKCDGCGKELPVLVKPAFVGEKYCLAYCGCRRSEVVHALFGQ